MLYVLAVLVGGILYRIPRGGPGREVWERLGIGIVSRINEEIWATATAGLIAAAVGSWWAVLIAPLLWLGEKPGWMKWVHADHVDVWPMNARGLLLLNPIMGHIYQFWQRHPTTRKGVWMDGYSAWAEVSCGLVTATAYLIAANIILN